MDCRILMIHKLMIHTDRELKLTQGLGHNIVCKGQVNKKECCFVVIKERKIKCLPDLLEYSYRK